MAASLVVRHGHVPDVSFWGSKQDRDELSYADVPYIPQALTASKQAATSNSAVAVGHHGQQDSQPQMRRKQVKRFIRQAVNRFARIYGFRPAVLRYRAVQWGNRRGIHIEIYR